MKKAFASIVGMVMLVVAPSAAAAGRPGGGTTSSHRQWLTEFGTRSSDRVLGGAVDASGNSFVVGGTRGTFSGQTSAGCEDAFVSKLDSAGNVTWSRQMGTPRDETAAAAATDGDGNVYVAGTVAFTLPGTDCQGEPADAGLWKYTASGALVWSRQFGSNSDHDFLDAATVHDSSLFVGGVLGGHAVVRRFTLDGTQQWSASFGSSSDWTQIDGLAADTTGVYAVGRVAYSSGPRAQTSDMVVVKYALTGGLVWQWTSLMTGDEQGLGVAAYGSAVYAVGHAGGHPFVVRLDATSGTTAWARQFTAISGWAWSVAPDAAGYAYVTGTIGYDAFLWKLAPGDGSVVWTEQSALSTSGIDEARNVRVIGNQVRVAGDTSGQFCRTCSVGGGDAFLAAFSTT